jgi:osmotically-inducible protein OsmY
VRIRSEGNNAEILSGGFLSVAGKFQAVILVLGTASLLSVLRRCQAQESSSAFSAGVARGTGSPTAANAKLEEAVYSMLRRDNVLRTANLKVDADVTKNEVTLSSTVDSDAMREKAVELAKTAQVGVVVNNRIKVRQGTTNRTGD